MIQHLGSDRPVYKERGMESKKFSVKSSYLIECHSTYLQIIFTEVNSSKKGQYTGTCHFEEIREQESIKFFQFPAQFAE